MLFSPWYLTASRKKRRRAILRLKDQDCNRSDWSPRFPGLVLVNNVIDGEKTQVGNLAVEEILRI